VGVAGSPSAEFERAVRAGLVDVAILVSRQLPQPLALGTAALELLALFARTGGRPPLRPCGRPLACPAR
jgi:hypothetical protein